jgi:phosphoglycerate transport regulatory protein PgtC
MRLPLRPEVYAKAPEGFPNPFKDPSIGAAVKFDSELSEGRYNLVNSLFDVTVTYRLDDLKKATKAIYAAEAALAKKPNAQARKLVDQAKDLVAAVPIDEARANDRKFAAIFEKERLKQTDVVPKRQAEVEEEWDRLTKENYAKARELAEQALSMK